MTSANLSSLISSPEPSLTLTHARAENVPRSLEWNEPTNLASIMPRLSIVISGTEMVEGRAAFLSFRHYVINVRLRQSQFKWTVRRRFRDFLKLHSALKLLQLRRKVGPLPSFPRAFHLPAQPNEWWSFQSNEHPRNDSYFDGATIGSRDALEDEDEVDNLPQTDEPAMIDRERKDLSAYLQLLVGCDMSNSGLHLVCAFLECSIVSFLPGHSQKPLETFVFKQNGGRLNRHMLTYLVDFMNLMRRSFNKKWLVVHSNCVCYYADLDKPQPQEVLLMDNYFDVFYGKEVTRSNRVLRIKNGYRELTLRTVSERRAKRIVEALNELKNSSCWCQSHPFMSFAPVREHQSVNFYVDAHSYFAAVADAISAAKKTIFLCDWMMSIELYLKRPPEENEESRLDNLLKRKASEGVRIYVLLYKEVEAALTLASAHVKHVLRGLHSNIQVLRHPDHTVGGTLFWAHHEKMVIVDEKVVFLGGLDLCFGRYDTADHPLMDIADPHAHAAIQQSSLAAGAGYFQTTNPAQNKQRSSIPTPTAQDQKLGQPSNVNQQLNSSSSIVVNQLRLKFAKNFGFSKLPEEEHQSGPSKFRQVVSKTRHLFPGKDYSNPFKKDFANLHEWQADAVDRQTVPRMPWHDVAMSIVGQGSRDAAYVFIQRWNFIKVEKARFKSEISFIVPKAEDTLGDHGTCQVQLLRSSSLWSNGQEHPETSILNAYIESINLAEHFIYIENQFFISNCSPDLDDRETIQNTITFALYQRIRRAFDEKQQFKVIVVVPLLPAFEGDVCDGRSTALRSVLLVQLRSITSLMRRIESDGIDSGSFIAFFGLRTWALMDELKTEIIYIHSKMMIIDDRVAIVGSANINDRSMLGSRDSEVAARVTDDDIVPSQMAGRPWTAGKSILNLRLALFREHLGLTEDTLINDPASDLCFVKAWRRFADRNTRIYRDVFHCIPDDTCQTWEAYRELKTFKPMPKDAAIAHLAKLQGHVVAYPSQFLTNATLETSSLAPREIFI